MINQLNLVLTAIALLFARCISACSPQVKSISPTKAAKLYKTKHAIVVDVREDDEWALQHNRRCHLYTVSAS